MLTVAERLALHQGASKRGCGGPGCRVFVDAHAQAEHARAKTSAVLTSGIRIGSRMTAVAEGLLERFRAGLRTGQRVEGRHRNEIILHTRGMSAWHMTIEADLGRIERERPGAFTAFSARRPLLREFWQPEPGAAAAFIRDLDRARDHANNLLQAEREGAGLPCPIEKRKKNRGADGRMSGKRQFTLWREDANVGPLSRIRWRKNEHRFGQIELARYRLHVVRIETLGVQNDSERIAGQAIGRKNIERCEAAGHDVRSPQRGSDRSAIRTHPAPPPSGSLASLPQRCVSTNRKSTPRLRPEPFAPIPIGRSERRTTPRWHRLRR